MLIFSFSFSKRVQSQPLSGPLNSTPEYPDEAKTGCANSVRAPTWDIQRRRDRLFTELYRKRMVGKPSLFCEDLGRQIHDPFLLAISRGQFCEPRLVKNNRTVKRRPNIVRNVAHKSNATWERCVACGAGHETVLYCAIISILMDQG